MIGKRIKDIKEVKTPKAIAALCPGKPKKENVGMFFRLKDLTNYVRLYESKQYLANDTLVLLICSVEIAHSYRCHQIL
jgi:hypothetical protein